jgi:hypothetical protein
MRHVPLCSRTPNQLRLWVAQADRRRVVARGTEFTLCRFPGGELVDELSYRPDCIAVKGVQVEDFPALRRYAGNEIPVSQKATARLRACANRAADLAVSPALALY